MSGGKRQPDHVAVVVGVIPRSLDMMAFSIAAIAFLSNGVDQQESAAPGTENEASCWIGTGVP